MTFFNFFKLKQTKKDYDSEMPTTSGPAILRSEKRLEEIAEGLKAIAQSGVKADHFEKAEEEAQERRRIEDLKHQGMLLQRGPGWVNMQDVFKACRLFGHYYPQDNWKI